VFPILKLNPAIIEHKIARPIIYLLLIVVSVPVLTTYVRSAQPYNGFDLDNSIVPANEIHHGGPPRDGIPAINKPRFLASAEAEFLQDQDYVLGLKLNSVTRAYPIKILNHHEIVNDTFGNQKILVTFCPLCGTGIAFEPEAKGKLLKFGVSGLLYNSDMLLYDLETKSLWSQIQGKAISGPMRGALLRTLPITHTTWGDWRHRHPATQVLSTSTGYLRNYQRNPYGDYARNTDIYFPVGHLSRRYHPKERVIGIEVNGKYRAYPFSELAKTSDHFIEHFNGKNVSVIYDKVNGSGQVTSGDRPVNQMTAYWFAWYAFHPDTSVFRSP